METPQHPPMPHDNHPTVPSERARKIIALAQDALAGVDEVRARIRRSTESALECGRLLLEEKARVHKDWGHGEWERYFEANFEAFIPRSTAWLWMKRANCLIGQTTVEPEPNRLRHDVLMMGLFPPKVHVIDPTEAGPEDDGTGNVDTDSPNHVSVINRFNEWWLWFSHRVESGKVGPDEAEQALKDFAPVLQCLRTLRETIHE